MSATTEATATPTHTESEVGPIRPPSEAMSLLLRVTRNCPWNKCAFCPVYKGEKFGKRSAEEVVRDIDILTAAATEVRGRAAASGETEGISSQTCLGVVHDPSSTYDMKRVALWLHRGGGHVFLQDADSLALPPGRVVRILRHLRQSLPEVTRVTTYARSRTLVARSAKQLAELKEAGLTRIHIGVESGAAEVLEQMQKGCKPKHHIDGGRRAVEAGFEVTCYVMPGLGGRRHTEAHARETAAVLKQIDPQHVRLRTTWVAPGSPLEELHSSGEFELLEEEEVVAEIREILRGLRGASGHVVSDHDLNLLMEIEGHLTDEADELEAVCTGFLELPPETRDAFVVGRRGGYFRSLAAFQRNTDSHPQLIETAAALRKAGDGSLIAGIARHMGRSSV